MRHRSKYRYRWKMKREQKMGFTGLSIFGFVLSLTVAGVFQNCARTNYEEDKGAAATTLGISRKLVIDPSFNQQKANLKVLFVVDDSFTMSQSQTQLANAVDSLLNPLKGHNVDFKIVSTSGVPSNEVDYVLSSRYMTEDHLTIPNSQIAGLPSYLMEKSVAVAASARHSALKLYRTSTTSEFDQLKLQVKSAILNVGVGGSDTEEGLCATARQLFDSASSSFF